MSDKKTARIVWKGTELNFQGTLGSGYAFDLSSQASPAAGSPMEFLLAAVAGCTAVDVVSTLRKMRQPLDGLVVEISGVRADDHPRVYTEATIVYVVRGNSIDPQAVEKAIKLSKEKYCSASAMFERAGVVLETDYRIEEG
ncbi:MAG TPA: OsmC family protein [Anaerolineae bacterium]